MEIEYIRLPILRNEEHYQFHSEFIGLVGQSTATTLGIEKDYPSYLSYFGKAGEALKHIRASAHTKHLAEADLRRGKTFNGMNRIIKASCSHFNPEIKQACERLHLVIENFGDVTLLPYDQETATLNHLLENLTASHTADLALAGLTDWVSQLRTDNTSFNTLMQTRYEEGAGKSKVNMKATRTIMDRGYNRMVKQINALILVNGEAAYSGFVIDLNERISHFNILLAIRKGHNGKDDNTDTTPEG